LELISLRKFGVLFILGHDNVASRPDFQTDHKEKEYSDQTLRCSSQVEANPELWQLLPTFTHIPWLGTICVNTWAQSQALVIEIIVKPTEIRPR
jgi:hypothetical protein